jgi:hypothetical protein
MLQDADDIASLMMRTSKHIHDVVHEPSATNLCWAWAA